VKARFGHGKMFLRGMQLKLVIQEWPNKELQSRTIVWNDNNSELLCVIQLEVLNKPVNSVFMYLMKPTEETMKD
jgi:hypothetical protein